MGVPYLKFNPSRRVVLTISLSLAMLTNITWNVAAQPGGFYQTSWVDWTSITIGNPGGSVSGTLNVGAATINVSYSGEVFNQTQTNGAGTDYYTPVNTYTNSVVQNPPTNGMITLVGSSTADTVTFSSPVTNPVMAFVSLGSPGNYVDFNFNTAFNILSTGPGWWGSGPVLTNLADTLYGAESDGVIQFIGTYTNLSWTVTGVDSYYSGFTLGVPNPTSPQITSVQGANAVIYQGDNWTVLASGTGANPLTFQWSFNTSNLTNQAGVSGAQSNALTIANVQTNETGIYKLTVTNAYGIATSNVTLTVLPDSDYDLFSPYAQTITNFSGLLGYWRFDPIFLTNSCVNGFTGALQGNAMIGAPGSGCPMYLDSANQGLVLDGINSDLTTSLTGQITNQGSLLAWVYLIAQPSTVGHTFSVVNQSQSGNNYDLQIETDNETKFYAGGNTPLVYAQALSLNQWNFLAATLDSTGLMKLYLNGQLVASTTGGTHSANNNPITIGESPVFTGRFFEGRIDEVAIYNVALTPAQITEAFAASLGGPTLQIASVENQVTVSWPTNFAAYVLQTNTSLSSQTWGSIASPYSVVSNNFVFTNRPAGSVLFYRLQR